MIDACRVSLDVHVTSILFSDGTEVSFADSKVMFVVGANNSGKSRTLAELEGVLRGDPGGLVVRGCRRTGADGTAIVAWLEEQGFLFEEVPGYWRLEWPTGGTTSSDIYSSIVGITSESALGHYAAQGLVKALTAIDRLQLASGQPSYDPATQRPSTSLQLLQADSKLEKQLAEVASMAFGEPVTLNRVAGPTLRLHVGEPARQLDLLDREYVTEISSLPMVDEQGDGYKAFIGLMLSLLTSFASIVLVDEPEAFLHPPQARRLGRELAARSASERQFFIATHSSDVLEGALQAGADVGVLRLTRDGDVNWPTLLDTEALRELWSDPLLRYSGALDALFARGLVICENERDCTFYLAVLEEDPAAPGDHDLEFVTVGGKSSIPRVARAIHALGVPVRAICDLDVLNDLALLERIIEALGGTVDDATKADFRVFSDGVRSVATPPKKQEIERQVAEAFSKSPGEDVSRDTWNDLKDAAKRPGGWARMKRDGISPLRGDQREAAERLIAALRDQGLFVVDKGELEAWVPDAGGKGPDWLARAFEREGHRRPEVREFVRPIADL
jgi:hypothetical protein